MQILWYRFRQFLNFYRQAATKYQLHSPFVFELANAVLGDKRWYYAFRDVEELRRRMLASDVRVNLVDFGAAPPGPPERGSVASPLTSGEAFSEKGIANLSQSGKKEEKVISLQIPHADLDEKKNVSLFPSGGGGRGATLRHITRRAASSPRQGHMLFRLAARLAPKTMLELGTSVGIGTAYLASAMRSARFVSLEGNPDCAQVARANLDVLGLNHVEIVTGEFDKTLPQALEKLQSLDFVFIDGNHRPEPTLRYFENCLPFASERAVFVFDDAYWSPGMTRAWEHICRHPRVTLTVDFFELSLAFINPDFKEKQHFRIVPVSWKPWKVF